MIEINVKKKLSPVFSIDFSHEENNSTLVLMGPSGCGKTTLLRAVAGLVKPDQGIIKICDKYFYNSEKNICLSPQSRRAGFLFQEAYLFPHLTGKANIVYGLDKNDKKLIMNGMDSPVLKSFELIVKTLEIDDMLNKMPSTMSGGQRQRIALARAIMIKPDILLLDEPFSSLDYILKRSLREYITRIVPAIVPRLIMVTHDIGDAQMPDASIIEMYQGSVKQIIQTKAPQIKVDFTADQLISF
jgi:molybdate transport system ATP-binding protein